MIRRKSSPVILLVMTMFVAWVLSACSSEVNYTPPPGSTDTAITHYSFGRLIIDGNTFENDLMILPDKEACRWTMGTTHQVHPKDIQAITDGTIKRVIIGTGASEGTSVLESTIEYLKSNGIETHILNTYDAVRLFNRSSKSELAAFFHINC